MINLVAGLLLSTLVDQTHVAQCIYFEARGEGEEGWEMVMRNIYTRVQSPMYPNKVYDVIWQPYQYSWTHDGKSDIPQDKELFKKILNFVRQQNIEDVLSKEVTHYHEVGVIPEWTNRLVFLGRVGNHFTYRTYRRQKW